MPEFELIDGWHVAVSQPVHNPTTIAVERAAAAATPSDLRYIALKKDGAVEDSPAD
jgi:hypothetical protein